MRQASIQQGCLYVVATPIGNLEDITFRAVRVLGSVDLIAAEDTRSAQILLGHYQIKTPVLSFFVGNESQRTEAILTRLQQGQSIALISESGMPGISDPGERLIQRCVELSIPLDVIPGPNAAVTALVLSGHPTSSFCFFGFLPRKGKERTEVIRRMATKRSTLILYEAPSRVSATITELKEALGDRNAALIRELTKVHQEARRGPLSLLAGSLETNPARGEITLVIDGASAPPELTDDELEHEVSKRLAVGDRPKAVAELFAEHGRRRVYQLALQLLEKNRREP